MGGRLVIKRAGAGGWGGKYWRHLPNRGELFRLFIIYGPTEGVYIRQESSTRDREGGVGRNLSIFRESVVRIGFIRRRHWLVRRA